MTSERGSSHVRCAPMEHSFTVLDHPLAGDLLTRLRDRETGGEWDSVQTFETIAPYTIEEAYEVADAIHRGDMDALVDELGDLQLQDRDQRSRVAGVGIGIYDREYLGKGYGREALGLLVDWAFRIQNYTRLWLSVWATNERAIRCYRAIGFVEEGRLRRQIFVDGQYVDVVLMGLLREEWRGYDAPSR